MIPIWIFLRKLGRTIKRGAVSSSLSTILVIIYGTLSEYYLQHNIPGSGIHTLFESLWWTMQTLTTVGYGDTPVVGTVARLNAMIIMVVGIGSLGYLLASISANIVNSRISQRIGRVRLRLRKHVIVCNFDSTGKDVVTKLNESGTPVVVVSKKEVESDGMDFSYVRGSCLDDETLKNAGISNSQTVIILGGSNVSDEEYSDADARTILIGMNVKRKYPEIHVVAEILDSANRVYAEDARIDEIIVKGQLTSKLITNSIEMPGVTRILMGLISGTGDNEIREMSLKKYRGKPFSSVYQDFDVPGNYILGIRKDGRIESRLPEDENVTEHSIIIMSRRR